MVKVCECCGHPLPSYHALLGLTRGQQRIFEIVEKAGKAGITADRVRDKLYADDANGGPDSPNVINVQRTKMNRALQEYDLKIRSTGGHHSIWRLEKL
jgi:hypothetical protein